MFARVVLSLGLLSATALTDPALAAGARTLQVIVSKDTQSLSVYDGGQLVATSKVSTGKPGHDTPTGIFSVLEKQKYHESNLYSSLLGIVHVNQPEKAPGPTKRLTKITPLPPTQLPTISVSRSGISEKREVLPEVNNVVLCRVMRITPRQAVVNILVCGDSVLEAEWQGLIRVQDVRATEKDRVKIYESFRPGDIVRAEVVCFLSRVFLLRDAAER